MVDRHVQRRAEFCAPFDETLVLPCINQVKADAVETGARDVKGRLRFGHRVQAAEPPQVGIVQRLNPHRYTIYTSVTIPLKPSGFDRPWIGLKRDLDVIGGRPVLACAFDDLGYGFGLHQTGCSAAEKDRVQQTIRRLCRYAVEFGQQRMSPPHLIDACGDMAVEIAIGALRLAERPVHVEAETPQAPVVSQNSPRRKPEPPWRDG